MQPLTALIFIRKWGFEIDSPDENLVKYYDDITEEILTKYFMVKNAPESISGYNYDFIPILNKQDKFIYHRTEKAVDLDVKDFYIKHINYEPDNLTHMESFHIRRKYELPVFGCNFFFGLYHSERKSF